MDRLKIDLLKAKYDLNTPQRRGLFFVPKLFGFTLMFIALFGTAFSYQVDRSGETNPIGVFSTISRLVLSGDKELKGEQEDRINFLLLGVGGKGHDGAELSDTIVFASVKPSTKEVGMLSIPRDLSIPIPGYGSRKINSVNAFAEAKEEGSGPAFASSVIGDLLQQPIDYYIKVNFDGFTELIDQIGGVDVYVERSFTDYQYPEYENSPTYKTIRFQEGWQKMNGQTALEFSRSRHGNNGEEGDFARAARQQKIILAIKAKVLSTSTLLNPNRLVKLVETLNKNITTNLSVWEILRLANELPSMSDDQITHHVLDDRLGGSLYAYNSEETGFIFLPVNNSWQPIQNLAAGIFSKDTHSVEFSEPTEPVPTFARIEIQNGTTVTGLATEASVLLKEGGFKVVKIGNAENQRYARTMIYDLTNGTQPEALQSLADTLDADVSMSATGWIFTNAIVPKELSVTNDENSAMATEKNIDFLVILGQNTVNLVRR